MRCAQLRRGGRNISRFGGSEFVAEILSSSAGAAPHREPCHGIDNGHVEAVTVPFGGSFAFETESQEMAFSGSGLGWAVPAGMAVDSECERLGP